MPVETRPYVPAMGAARLLPCYDAFARAVGARPVQWRLVAQAAVPPGATVLEIGAGTGSVLLMVGAAVGSATLIGLDPDPGALAVAQRRAAAAGVALRLETGYADALPLADGSVDRVLSSFMFHHLTGDQKAATLAEARRVLAPGGSLHLVDIGDGGMPGLVGRLMHRRHPHAHGPEPASRLLELLGDAGFTDAAVVGRGRTRVGPVTFVRAG